MAVRVGRWPAWEERRTGRGCAGNAGLKNGWLGGEGKIARFDLPTLAGPTVASAGFFGTQTSAFPKSLAHLPIHVIARKTTF